MCFYCLSHVAIVGIVFVYSVTYIESKEKTTAQSLVCVHLTNKTEFDSDNVFYVFCFYLYLLFRPIGEPTPSDTFTSEKVFKAVSQGNTAELHGLLEYLQRHNK